MDEYEKGLLGKQAAWGVKNDRGCYKYWLSNVYIHHKSHAKSLGPIGRDVQSITHFRNYSIDIICIPCMIPEPNKGQDQKIERIYPAPSHIYTLLLTHTITGNYFDQGPIESFPNVIHSHSHDSMHFPWPKHLPQQASIPWTWPVALWTTITFLFSHLLLHHAYN